MRRMCRIVCSRRHRHWLQGAQGLALVDRLTHLKKQLTHAARLRRPDLMLHLHGLDNDEHIARGHRIARLNEPLHHLRQIEAPVMRAQLVIGELALWSVRSAA